MTAEAVFYKIVLCGDYGVGKSNLLRHFANRKRANLTANNDGIICNSNLGNVCSELGHDEEATSEVVIRQFLTAPGRIISIELWDTAGVEQHNRHLSPNYFADVAAVIVCYSLSRRSTFIHVLDHVTDAVHRHPGLVTDATQNAVLSPLLFLCGNQDDVDYKLDRTHLDVAGSRVTSSDFRDVVDRIRASFGNQLAGTFTVSCQTGTGVQEMFQDVARYVDCDKDSVRRRQRRLSRSSRHDIFVDGVDEADSNSVTSTQRRHRKGRRQTSTFKSNCCTC